MLENRITGGISLLLGGLILVISNGNVFYKCGVYIPLVLYGVWSFIPTVKWPDWLNRSTFAIYVMHVILFKYLAILVPHNLGGYLLQWGMGVLVPVCINYFMSVKLPMARSICFGGR